MTQQSRFPPALIGGALVLLAAPLISVVVWFWIQWHAIATNYPFIADVISLAALLLPMSLGTYAAVLLLIIIFRRYGWRESIAAHYAIALKRAEVQVAPAATSYSYHVAQPALATGQQLALPSPIDVLKPLGAWLAWIDEQPHTLLAGRTKAGKTHTATAILARRLQRGEQVYIIDPHSSGWLSLPTVGFVGLRDGKLDTAALHGALMAVAHEYIRRMQVRDDYKSRTGQELPHDYFTRLTVLIDEANYIADTLPTVWREFLKALSSGGRKVGISLVCLVQSPLVEDIQVSGSMRANFARLGLDDRSVQQLIAGDEKDADRKKALSSALAGVERPAAATIDAQVWLLDRRGLDAGTAPANARALVWDGKASSVSSADDGRSEAESGKETSMATSAPAADTSMTSTLPTAAEIATIAARLGTLPPSKVAETLDGYHPRKYAEYKAKVDYVQTLLQEATP